MIVPRLSLAIFLLISCGCPASGDGPRSQPEGTAATADDVSQPLKLTAREIPESDQEPEADLFTPPEWLLEAPPIYALFPGNGDVVTLGQLGSYARSKEGEPLEDSEFGRWYIYDQAGELLNGLPDGIHWWEHYDTEWTERTRTYFEKQVYSSEYAGYTMYYRGEFEVLEVYDYDGTLMPEGFDPFSADEDRMHGLTGEELLGLVNPGQ